MAVKALRIPGVNLVLLATQEHIKGKQAVQEVAIQSVVFAQPALMANTDPQAVLMPQIPSVSLV